MTKTLGSKFDEDKYDKVDLSLVPWGILIRGTEECSIRKAMHLVHTTLNRKSDVAVTKASLDHIFDIASEECSVEDLAVSLGYGEVKYGRGNWRQGFGGDWKRFLRATLRHCLAHLRGQAYDGLALEGYPLGNSHKGAILFSLMVAINEVVEDFAVVGDGSEAHPYGIVEPDLATDEEAYIQTHPPTIIEAGTLEKRYVPLVGCRPIVNLCEE